MKNTYSLAERNRIVEEYLPYVDQVIRRNRALMRASRLEYDDVSQVKTLGSVGLVYRPWDNGAFRVNWSQGFRVPNIQELFLITSTGTLQMGNPDLKPEESDNFEVGFRWENPNGGLMADASLFYTISDNYIETARNGQFYTYHNIAEAKSYGFEAALSYLTQWNVEPYLNVTIMERKYETQAGSSTNTGTPKFFGNTGVKYYGRYFDLDGFANFATKTKNDNLDGWSYFGPQEYGGYVTFNLRISTSFGDKDQFTVYGSVENILDKSYQTNEIIHEPGRFFPSVDALFLISLCDVGQSFQEVGIQVEAIYLQGFVAILVDEGRKLFSAQILQAEGGIGVDG